jgi:hypothetical protein
MSDVLDVVKDIVAVIQWVRDNISAMGNAKQKLKHMSETVDICSDTVIAVKEIHARIQEQDLSNDRGILTALKHLLREMNHAKQLIQTCKKMSKLNWAMTGKKVLKTMEDCVSELRQTNSMCFQSLQIWTNRLSASEREKYVKLQAASQKRSEVKEDDALKEEMKENDVMDELHVDEAQFDVLKGIIETKWMGFQVTELIQITQTISMNAKKARQCEVDIRKNAGFVGVFAESAVKSAAKRNSILTTDKEQIQALREELKTGFREDRVPVQLDVLKNVQRYLDENARAPLSDAQKLQEFLIALDKLKKDSASHQRSLRFWISELRSRSQNMLYENAVIDPTISSCLRDAQKKIQSFDEKSVDPEQSEFGFYIDTAQLLENCLLRAEKNIFSELVVQSSMITSSDKSGYVAKNLIEFQGTLRNLEKLQQDALDNIDKQTQMIQILGLSPPSSPY